MKKILLTGFGSFAQHDVNPTEKLVLDFDQKAINNFLIISKVLPVTYNGSMQKLQYYIEEYRPSVIISLGYAANRSKITPELIAVNYQHSEHADNAGVIKLFSKIDNKSKDSFFSTLPIEQMVEVLKNNSIAAELSSTAGTYVCNTTMYEALRYTAQQKYDCLAGFIHIPPNMNNETLTDAITSCINCL